MEKKKVKLVSEKDIVFDGKFWIDENGVRHRYIDPLCDEGFKILFGSEGNEDLLIELLNKVLPGVEVVDLKYCNTEHHGITEADGKAIFDVYCEDADGVRFLVEMQNWSQHYFNKRAVYYSSFAIQDQAAKEKRHQLKTLGKDRWDYNYAPVYLVCFLTFNMKKARTELRKIKEDEYISIYKYCDVETSEELEDGTTLIFIEMKKFRKSLDECKTDKEKWICSLKSMGEQLEMPDTFLGTVLESVYEKAELATIPNEKRINYISETMSRNDELNSRAEMIEDALQEGYAKGRDEGLVEGEAKGKAEAILETCKKLKELGVDIDTIIKATGIDSELIQNM